MEKYVVSKDLAEKLKVVGYPQETQFSHEPIGNDWCVMATHDCVLGRSIAAPLSDELLEQLPEIVKDEDRPYAWRLEIKRLGSGVTVSYTNDAWVRDNKSALKRKGYADSEIDNMIYATMPVYSDKPADALAELWIWVKEHGYLDA